MSDVTVAPRIGSNSLPELASRIVREHEAIQNAPHVVVRAISLGKLLIEAKNNDGQYGKWSTWLKDNCREEDVMEVVLTIVVVGIVVTALAIYAHEPMAWSRR
jgi:hypothetical protein